MECPKKREKIVKEIDSNENKDSADNGLIDFEEEKEWTPDGGWGWFIVLGCVLSLMITGGMRRSSGILFLKIEERFERSATATSWVFSLASAFGMMSGPLTSSLSNRFSVRSVCIFGGLLMSTAAIMSGFAQTLEFLYFSHGIVSGFGQSCTYVPAYVLVGLYFKKRRGIAIGLASSGTGFGAFFMPLLVNFIFNVYGYNSAFIMISGLFLNLVVCGALYRPLTLQKKLMAFDRRKRMSINSTKDHLLIPMVETLPENTTTDKQEHCLSDKIQIENDKDHCSHCCLVTEKPSSNKEYFKDSNTSLSEKATATKKMLARIKKLYNGTKTTKTEKKKIFDLTLLKDYRFLSFAFSIMFFEFSHNIINVFLPSFAIQQGVEESRTSYMLSITGIVDTVSRIVSGAIMDFKNIKPYRIIINNLLMYSLIIVCCILPTLDSFVEFCILAGIFGCVNGSYFAQKTLILIEIVGVEKITSSFGLIMVFQGTGTLIGPPISGFLKDYFGSWKEGFYFGAAVVFFGAGLFSISNIIHYVRSRERRSDA